MKNGSHLFIYAGAVFASTVAHAVVIGGLSGAVRRRSNEKPRPVEMALVTPPPVVEEVPEQPIEVEQPTRKPPPPKKKKVEPPPPPDTPPPSNSESPPDEPEESAPPVFGVTMESTVSGGSGMRVRVGNTLMKDPEKTRTPPEDVKPYAGPPKKNYVAPSQVSKMARPRGECRGDYPIEAKRLGIEGKVRLVITIEEDGTVGEVNVKQGLGYGLDQVAVAALKKCKFDPAFKEGKPVAIRVPYTYTFQLDTF